MTPTFDKIHLKFKLNGISYNHSDLKEVGYSLIKEGDEAEKAAGDFLLDWLDGNSEVKVKTSGSTGTQKNIMLKKQSMVNSAVMTGDFFGLEPGDSAINCLPCSFIAGKMMLVRAMILGLELEIVPPSLNPSYDHQKHYDFCAMIPIQLKNSLQRLDNIKTLIVGGASVSNSIVKELSEVNAKVYEVYGMTETVSHVAIKALNHTDRSEAPFKTLRDVSIRTDDRNCLIIKAPELSDEEIHTNDIVNLMSKDSFEIIGRYDNMINSAGVKLFPEMIEKKLQDKIDNRFLIASKKDSELGEKVIMILESENNSVDKSVFSDLDKYEVPKEIYNLPKFIETETLKVQRQKTYNAVFSGSNSK